MKAIIFDLDGTIADTLPLCIASFREAIEPLSGKSLPDREIIATFGPSEEGTIAALIPEKYEEALEGYQRCYRDMHHTCPRPFDGMTELLKRLKEKGVFLALVTGKGHRSCATSLAQFGLEGIFDAVETGSPLGNRKTEAIIAIMEANGIARADALYIGDTASDVRSSHKAGIDVVSAAWAATSDVEKLEKANPGKVVTSIEELSKVIDSFLDS